MGKKRKDRTPETAYNVGGEPSSTSNTLNSTPPWEYDVFLSFAGKDTRLNFTGHLYDAFSRSGIRCFRDDLAIQRGEDINSLFQAIEDSLCAVVVISKNYAKSKWCLDELQKILRSRKKLGRRVFPIFYNVDPADVRHQRKSFGKAFAKHEEKFKENSNKVQSWRTALSKIGNFSGWVTRDKPEAELIRDVVGTVSTYLNGKLPSYDDNLVGIELRVRDVETILGIGLDDKRGVGIWGMGGVGKTTLAGVVYKKISCKFEDCCFIANVRDTFQKEGIVSLQKKLLSDLNIKDVEISSQYKGKEMIRKHLSNKKVLLVLDDVDDMSQLKYLAESPDWFGKGSIILITTRDSHMLNVFGVQRMYDMKTMNEDESLQLFSRKAFKEDYPKEDYLELSKSVIEYAGGLPLALEVLGSYLLGRSRAEWRDVLDRLKQFPNDNIVQVLQISYDGLNEEEKTIFLDIACCFKGWPKKGVTQILKSCDLHPTIGMKVLIEKALLVETKDGRLEMHDLIEELGRHIVHQESPKDVCKRSRLWKFKEIKEVLESNKGSGEVEAIVMDNYWDEDKIIVHPEAFSRMSRLRLLLLDFRRIPPTGLEKLSGALKFVGLPRFLLEDRPLRLDGLGPIEMQRSNIKQLWNGIKSMNHLKIINLSNCRNFTESTSDFSNVQSLGHLYLSRCNSLLKVHESLALLKELVVVDLSGCLYLNNLPSKLETNSLRKLDISWCKRLKKLPEFGEGMKKLEYLDASHTGITTLPKSFGSLTGLRELNLSSTDLINLPTDCFSGFFGLVLLSLGDCDWLESLPRLPPRLIRLEAGGCFTIKRSLDEQMFNLVTSLDPECRGQTKYVITDEEEENMPRPYERDYYSPFELKDAELEDLPLRNFFAIMPSGGKIPSWFDSNIKYYEKARTKCEIEVVVPPHFRASKWSGIVVCLHIKGHDGFIRWSSKAPDDDEYNIWEERARGIGSLYWSDGLCIMVLEFNQKSCWQHLRDDNNFLHIQLSSDKYPMIVEDDVDIVDILGCGWRVICKEDIQNWGHPNHLNHFTQPQQAPPSEVTLPWPVLRRLLGVSVKPRMMLAHSSKNLNKRKTRNSNKMVL
ncbi:hypothetical protein K1719_014252 [Acacia pycnantha]|nr:hypothetical protein K1719_014252 [Acacia pycnantha]